jgi:hypothetical protein
MRFVRGSEIFLKNEKNSEGLWGGCDVSGHCTSAPQALRSRRSVVSPRDMDKRLETDSRDMMETRNTEQIILSTGRRGRDA